MNILIVFTSIEGQTRKIADFIKESLQPTHKVTVVDITDADLNHISANLPNSDDFDVIFVGCSLHKAKYHSAITAYIKQNIETLNSKPSAFFSVSLGIVSELKDERETVELITTKFLNLFNWQPKQVVQIAGALRYSKYNFLLRLVMKKIAKKNGIDTYTSKDYEYTDWDAVKQFATGFVNSHLG